MSSQISFNDGSPTVGSKDNGSLVTITLANFDNTGVLGWFWQIVDRPQGSAAALSDVNAAAPTFDADVRGTYLVRLTTYTDAGRTSVDDIDEQLYAVRLGAPFDWRVPAAGETTQLDSTRGWASAREESIRDVHSFMNSGLPQFTAVVNQEVLFGAEVVLGGFVMDPTEVPTGALKLRVMGVLTLVGAGTGDLRLYDMGAVGGGAIAGVLRATSTLPNGTAGEIVVTDTALSTVASPGVDADEVINARRRYEIRAELVGGASGDSFKIHNGGITLEG